MRARLRRLPVTGYLVLTGVLSALFALRMLGGGLVGLSDQGDGHRLLCQLGLRQGNAYNTSTRDHLYPLWFDHTWYGEDCGAAGERYRSTQLAPAWVATRLTHLLTDHDGLDLGVLAVLSSLLVGALVAALTLLVARRWPARLLVAAALFLVAADATFAGYFASAYSEPATFTGLLALTATVVVLLRAPVVRFPHLLAVTAATALLVGAKTQNATALAAVVPLLLVRPLGRGGSALVRRLPALGLAAALVAGTGAYLHAQPDRFTTQNDYAAVFVEMLPHSPDPAGDLAALGLPAAMVTSSGVPIGAPGSAANSPAFDGFSERASLPRRLGVYLRDPVRLVAMADRGAEGMGRLRADYVYSYPASAGRPQGALECRVCVVHDAWRAAFGGRPLVLLAAYLLAVGACVVVAHVRRRQPATRALAGAGLVLAVALAAQFWVVLLTDGASDLVKHLVGANFTLALLLVLATAAVGALACRDPRDVPAPQDPAAAGS
ncbi:glycan biosynthesis hexose transferase WsfD [Kineococcus terrestris]|uniref:glycan biosynthesis hexose transferase WsfD n=1 Tax=Kineococcus terrestris TaxID=2044856 RepID=UPI0034DB50B2